MVYTTGSDGVHSFSHTCSVEPGTEIQYKFRVGTGNWWVLKEDSPTAGNQNNVLKATASSATSKTANDVISHEHQNGAEAAEQGAISDGDYVNVHHDSTDNLIKSGPPEAQDTKAAAGLGERATTPTAECAIMDEEEVELDNCDGDQGIPTQIPKTYLVIPMKLKSIVTRLRGKVNHPGTTGAPVEEQKKLAPAAESSAKQVFKAMAPSGTDPTLNIVLKNNTRSNNLYAHITGLAIDKGGVPFFLQSDGVSAYYPQSPGAILSPLPINCAISLGAPGSARTVTVPRLAGARIWFCEDGPLTFLINPGPAIVEPSVHNPSDPNYNLSWGFAEFTYNDFQLFVNVSYVDFVSIPVSLTLETKAGEKMTLLEQDARDKAGWSKLVVRKSNGSNLRALSPNSGIVASGGSLFKDYYTAHVDAVWEKYRRATITINTQNGNWGNVNGRVTGDGLLTFDGGVGRGFPKPAAVDIFNCDTGPFGRGPDWSELRGNVGARLAAGFNRSTLLAGEEHPEGAKVQGTTRKL
ncbi:unnamed protein product [Parascedosporium putredinis]|uniref:GH64 domain-containing protein n=1 Tax=Parascedosporium putredinis TaxID=1442378 RepID=A0A9P1H6Z1_9PEZI|nr:unnamed protein product [Parascedosporium putredinis]CAI8000911.1 unnamed protein product [Parascedosporium putredinis]